MAKLKWGIISTAKIGTGKVIAGIQRSALNEIVAIASRDEARAKAVAAEFGIPRTFGSYEAMLADPEIEIVYNPLPNHLHVPVSLAALEAGKHVLCEKPISINATEAARLAARPEKPYLMEAFMVRFHPQWHRARDLIRSGELGEVKQIQINFAYFNVNPEDIRNKPETGGGALYDIGGYALVAGRFMFEADPVRVFALFDRDPAFGTDRRVSGIADFGEGRQLSFVVSTQSVLYQRMNILGTKKRLDLPLPFSTPANEEACIFIDDASVPGGYSVKPETIRASNHFSEEADAFARAVLGETPLPYGPADAVLNMKVIDAMYRSEKSGSWEKV
jgi:predicted dehydrogenase